MDIEFDEKKSIEYNTSTINIIPEEAYWEITKRRIGQKGRGRIIDSAKHITATKNLDIYNFMKEHVIEFSQEIEDENAEGIYTAKLFKGDGEEVKGINGEQIVSTIVVRENSQQTENKNLKEKDAYLDKLQQDVQIQKNVAAALASGITNMQLTKQYKDMIKTVSTDDDSKIPSSVEKEIETLKQKLQEQDKILREEKERKEKEVQQYKEMEYLEKIEEIKENQVKKEESTNNIFVMMMQQSQQQREEARLQMELQRKEIERQREEAKLQIEHQREEARLQAERQKEETKLQIERQREEAKIQLEMHREELKQQKEEARKSEEERQRFFAMMQQQSEKSYQMMIAMISQQNQPKESIVEKLAANPIAIAIAEKMINKDTTSPLEKVLASPNFIAGIEKIADKLGNKDTNQLERIFSLMNPFIQKLLDKKENNPIEDSLPKILSTYTNALEGSQKIITNTYQKINDEMLNKAFETGNGTPEDPWIRRMKGFAEAIKIASPSIKEAAREIIGNKEQEPIIEQRETIQKTNSQPPIMIPNSTTQNEKTEQEMIIPKEETIQQTHQNNGIDSMLSQLAQALTICSPQTLYDQVKVTYSPEFLKMIKMTPGIKETITKYNNPQMLEFYNILVNNVQ